MPSEAKSDDGLTDSEDSGSSDVGSIDDETELRQLVASIKTRITLLMRLSMAIRKPAAHDQLINSADIDTSNYEQFDARHVREKFPRAPDDVVRRLGRAILRRRQYFKYREEHAKKLAHGLKTAKGTGQDAKTELQPQSTIASSLPHTLKANAYLDLEAKEGSDTGVSRTSFATSRDGGFEGPRVPPLPNKAREGEPFECSFCFMLVSITTRKSWRYALNPYSFSLPPEYGYLSHRV